MERENIRVKAWETFWSVSSKVETALNEGRYEDLSVYNI